ncbi:MAG: CHASE2 domain-containing protein [Betaproteobacteria bacterium]|nr:MAG: CHASE2 domain-containing protein [Betaproteobacteria bacterium]
MKKHLVRFSLGFVVVLAFVAHAIGAFDSSLLDRLELALYDARLRLTMPGGVDQRIVIVDVDEKSLAVEGRWPWRRDKVGMLVDQLFDHYQAGLVGFDVVFSEPGESSGLTVLRELSATTLRDDKAFQDAVQRLSPRLEYDRVFSEKLRNRPVVLGYYFTNPEESSDQVQSSGLLPDPVLGPGTFTDKNIRYTSWLGYAANLPELQRAAAGAGHFNTWPDEDGVTRRVPMLVEHAGAFYAPLSLALVRLGLGSQDVVPGFPKLSVWNRNYPGLEWLEVGGMRVPVDEMMAALVPYRGAVGSYAYVSATDVLRGVTPVELLRNKIILVGTTTPGLYDLRAAPVGEVYPGVEIHANLIAGMLDGTIMHRPPYVLGAEVALLLLCGVSMTVLLPLFSPLRATLLTVAILAGLVGLNLLVWVNANTVLPLASGMTMIALLFALNMSYGYFVESRAKHQITSRFGQYVPAAVVEEMSRHHETISMEGERRELSVLFSDIRGFTSISERLGAKELTSLMNQLMTPLTQLVYQYRGTIDKYMGDCLMAFWGAPLKDPEHAQKAVLCGLEMHKTIRQLTPAFRARNWPEIEIGVGVNSGKVVVGNMGSELRIAYTVIGDAVNLASRLESLTKHYGVPMIVGERTRSLAPELVYRELDKVVVKGSDQPVTIYEPMGRQGEVDAAQLDALQLWAQFLRLYRTGEWDKAELQLLNLQKQDSSRRLYQLFMDRISGLRSNPPVAPWDGATRFEPK